MNLKPFFILLTFTLVGQYSYGQKQIPADFMETDVPQYGSKEWSALNYSFHNAFGVEIKKGKLAVHTVQEQSKCELAISGGTLVGINRGEWGGQLTFVPTDTTKQPVAIKGGNITSIFRFLDKIYFTEGLAHLSLRDGALYELEITNNQFVAKKLMDLEDAPAAYTIYKNQLFLACSQSLYVVKDFKKELLFKDTFWGGLYPTSIAVIDEKNVFLGIRGGIVKLNVLSKDIKLYIPKIKAK